MAVYLVIATEIRISLGVSLSKQAVKETRVDFKKISNHVLCLELM